MSESLTDFLIKSHDGGIHTVARFIARCIRANYQRMFEQNFGHLTEPHGLMDDRVYQQYLKLLFEPVEEALRGGGFAARPALADSFAMAREWGPEHERQKWLWSKISSPTGQLLGTLLVIFYHDHTQVRIPRPPLVLPLQERALENELDGAIEAGMELTV